MRFDAAYIRRMADDIRAILGDDFDIETFLDTLDGETSAMDMLGHLIRDREEAKSHASACDALAKTYADRAKRLKARGDAMTNAMGDILDAMGERKVAHPLGTVSRTKGRASVQIVDPDAVPTQLCKVVKTPDKTAIKAQLDAGEHVPGAEMQTAPNGVSVRIK